MLESNSRWVDRNHQAKCTPALLALLHSGAVSRSTCMCRSKRKNLPTPRTLNTSIRSILHLDSDLDIDILNRANTILRSVMYALACQRHGDHHHSWRYAILYCCVLAVSFVGSLYILVPLSVQRLPRDSARHIQWRSAATGLVGILAWWSYPWLFCDEWAYQYQPIVQVLQRDSLACGRVLLHTLVLFMGPLLQCVLAVYTAIQHREGNVTINRFVQVYCAWYWEPIVIALWRPAETSTRWIKLRNLVVAPLTEEMVFRACMVPSLRSVGMSVRTVSLVAPLFFGFAHWHHAHLKLQQPNQQVKVVLVETLVQFTYTTLFGAYESYAYLQTRSLLAITLCHAFCNAMGLPDLSYLQSYSPLFVHRVLLSTSLAIGMMAFIWGMAFLGWP
jgi:prenyl protein peptidase